MSKDNSDYKKSFNPQKPTGKDDGKMKPLADRKPDPSSTSQNQSNKKPKK